MKQITFLLVVFMIKLNCLNAKTTSNPCYIDNTSNLTINNPTPYASSDSSSSMEDFFKQKGIKLLASLAHPTNTFISGNHVVYSDKIWVKIFYENYTTELEIKRDGNFFTDINIISDNDWISPFSGITFIKNIAYEALKDENSNKKKIEKKIGKEFSDMKGVEMACLVLTLKWWNYLLN